MVAMDQRDLAAGIARRLKRARLSAPGPALLEGLTAYLMLLARWNRRVNLTAFDLERPADEAIDRLVVEPLAAARRVASGDRLVVDVGSGGGSPAIPLKLAVPRLAVVLVESKIRKCAFLAEAIRTLGLTEVEVENRRVEELLARSDLHEAADLVTLRAVRPDRRLWMGAQAFLRRGGRVFWFCSAGQVLGGAGFPELAVVSEEALVPATGTRLVILTKEI
jgi:16S rRNA (guanine527-N7)-methyltransferase